MKICKQNKNFKRLFCPSYDQNIAARFTLKTIAKKFIKIVKSVVNELERIGNTERFKNKIANAIEKANLDENWDSVAKETKVYSLQKELNQIMIKLHFSEVLSGLQSKQLSDQIISIYEKLLNQTDHQENKIIKFEEELKALVSNLVLDLEYNLSITSDTKQKMPKHKRLELHKT